MEYFLASLFENGLPVSMKVSIFLCDPENRSNSTIKK